MATSGRNIYEVREGKALVGYGSRDSAVWVTVNETMTRTELMKAYARRFRNIRSGNPINLEVPELVTAIISGVIPERAYKAPRGHSLISPEQIQFLQDLFDGGWASEPPRADMSKAEAHRLIDEAIRNRRNGRKANEPPKPEVEPPWPSGADGRGGRIPDNPWGSGDVPNPRDNGRTPDNGSGTPTPSTVDLTAIESRLDVLESTVGTVTDRVNEHDSALAVVSESLTVLTARVENIRPRIIRVELPDRPPIEITARRHDKFEHILVMAHRRQNIFLIGPPGTGKSTIAEQVAQAFGIPYGNISFGPTTPESRIMGFKNAMGEVVDTEFEQIWRYGGVFNLDEVDNGHGGIVATTNTALSNGYCTFASGRADKHCNTIVFATGNTNGTGANKAFSGRNPVDAATLNRFTKVVIGYDEIVEDEMAAAISDSAIALEWKTLVRKYRQAASDANLPCFFTPRDTVAGIELLVDGIPWDDVVEYRLTNGLSEDNDRLIRAEMAKRDNES